MTQPSPDPCPPPAQHQDYAGGGQPRVAPTAIGDDGTWPMPPGSGPCRTWPLEPGCGCLAPGAVKNGSGESPWGGAKAWTPEQTHAVELATEILWRLTAGRFGLCKEIIRPCRKCTCTACSNGLGFAPELHDGRWVNMPCGSCGSSAECGCPGPDMITLPGPAYWEPLIGPPDWTQRWRPPPQPAHIPTDGNPTPRYRLIVWINGTVLKEPGWPVDWEPGDPIPPDYTPSMGQYWLDGGNRLLRTDGGTWPTCQNLAAPIQEWQQYPGRAVDSFAVEYWRGTPVPPGGRRAVSILACELWKACGGGGGEPCRLPQHVQSITREGVQYQMVDTTDYVSQGRVGLADVDMWVASVNPKGHRSPPGVWTPDLPHNVSEWTSGGRS